MNERDTGALNEFSRAIGALEGKVGGLSDRIDRDGAESSSHRESLRQVLTSLTEAVRVLTSQNESWRQDWKLRWQPLMEHYETSRHEAAGRAQIGKAIATLWMGIASGVGALLTWFLTHHWK